MTTAIGPELEGVEARQYLTQLERRLSEGEELGGVTSDDDLETRRPW